MAISEQRGFFDLEALAIDQHVFGLDDVRGRHVAFAQRIDGARDGLFDHAAEDQHFVLQPLELAVKGGSGRVGSLGLRDVVAGGHGAIRSGR